MDTSNASRSHIVPFAVWMVLLLLVQQLHLTDVIEIHEGNITRGLGVLSMGGAYAWRVGLGALVLLLFRPWRYGYARLERRNVIPALAMGVAVFLLWVGMETAVVRGLAPGLAELYEKWCVLPFGKLREPSVFVQLEQIAENPSIPDLAGQFCPMEKGTLPTLVQEGYAAAAGSTVGNFYAPRVSGWWVTIVRLVGSAFVISIIEEFFWRGFLYRWIQKVDFLTVNPGRMAWPSFLLTAVIFGAEHTEWLAGILCGLLYGWLYIKTKDIWAASIAHMVTNFLLGIYVLVTGSYQFW